MDGGDRPPPPGPAFTLLRQRFGPDDAPRLRQLVSRCARAAGLTGRRLEDFVLAVHELVTNAVRHGGGSGLLRLHRVGDTLRCEVNDHGPGMSADDVEIDDPPPANQPGGRGLWIAGLLADRLEISPTARGLSVAVSVKVTDEQA